MTDSNVAATGGAEAQREKIFDGTLIKKLKELLASVDPAQITQLISMISTIITLLKPLFPATVAGQASVMSVEPQAITTALEAHKAEIEAQGFEFGSFITFVTALLPLINRLNSGDWSALGEIAVLVLGYISELKTA